MLFKFMNGTQDGGYVVGGISDSGIGFDKTEANKGDYDYWIVKLDAAGNRQWDRTLGTRVCGQLAEPIECGEQVGGS